MWVGDGWGGEDGMLGRIVCSTRYYIRLEEAQPRKPGIRQQSTGIVGHACIALFKSGIDPLPTP